MNGDDEKRKDKSDYTEVEFELGNMEFEAKGRSVVVERMFRMLLDKIESGGLVVTLKLEDYDEEDEEEVEREEDEEESEFLEEDDEKLIDDSDDYMEKKEKIKETLKDTLKEIDKAVPTSEQDDDSRIPTEAYLEPPPEWDSLDDSSPPESDVERDELGPD